MNNEFNILLRLHRRKVHTKNIATPKWLYPLATEKVYSKGISTHMKKYVNSNMRILETKLEGWIKASKFDYRADTWEDDFRQFKEDMKKAILLYFGLGLLFDSEIGKLIQESADKIMAYSLKQWQKQTEAVLGDPYSSMPPDWIDMKRMWMEENYRYIKELAEEYNAKLETLIATGIAASWAYNDFADQIQKLNKAVIGYRSALIGRDQTGLLVSSIAKNYAKSIGNDEYMWQTALDERVRGNPTGRYPKAVPSHWIMEGLLCKWSDNSVYSEDGGKTWKKRLPVMEKVPPGMAFACRCTPGMYWNNFVKEVGG